MADEQWRIERSIIEVPRQPLVGFRFVPTQQELIMEYLCKMANGLPVPLNLIPERDVYAQPPWRLSYRFKYAFEEGEFYYFARVNRSGASDGRLSRRVDGVGHWKAHVTKKQIIDDRGRIIGNFMVLKFYVDALDPNGSRRKTSEATKWIMREYRLAGDLDKPQAKEEVILCHFKPSGRCGIMRNDDGIKIQDHQPEPNINCTGRAQRDQDQVHVGSNINACRTAAMVMEEEIGKAALAPGHYVAAATTEELGFVLGPTNEPNWAGKEVLFVIKNELSLPEASTPAAADQPEPSSGRAQEDEVVYAGYNVVAALAPEVYAAAATQELGFVMSAGQEEAWSGTELVGNGSSTPVVDNALSADERDQLMKLVDFSDQEDEGDWLKKLLDSDKKEPPYFYDAFGADIEWDAMLNNPVVLSDETLSSTYTLPYFAEEELQPSSLFEQGWWKGGFVQIEEQSCALLYDDSTGASPLKKRAWIEEQSSSAAAAYPDASPMKTRAMIGHAIYNKPWGTQQYCTMSEVIDVSAPHVHACRLPPLQSTSPGEQPDAAIPTSRSSNIIVGEPSPVPIIFKGQDRIVAASGRPTPSSSTA